MTQWAMAIDLDLCTGCSACVVACQSENNVAPAGEKLAAAGHAIAWLRMERHVEGSWPDVRAGLIPVLCQHCDEAPCVPACPVGATHENDEGLNVQSYARCTGLGFCVSACPYHARQLNRTPPQWPDPLDRMLNPDVAVREPGVAEKCTFCAQRIRRGRREASLEGREPRDGEIRPACAQSCPARAIEFGDGDDPDSAVSRRRADPRAFHLGESYGTKPRVTYLRSRRQD